METLHIVGYTPDTLRNVRYSFGLEPGWSWDQTLKNYWSLLRISSRIGAVLHPASRQPSRMVKIPLGPFKSVHIFKWWPIPHPASLAPCLVRTSHSSRIHPAPSGPVNPKTSKRDETPLRTRGLRPVICQERALAASPQGSRGPSSFPVSTVPGYFQSPRYAQSACLTLSR